jgi:two-component sensor histidine kinase/ligand-binding sensor protein
MRRGCPLVAFLPGFGYAVVMDSDREKDSPVEDMSLGSLLDLSLLQGMADHLYAAGGIPVGILSPEGEVLVGAGWQDICTKFHRAHPSSLSRCLESDAFIKGHLGEAGYTAYKCLNHLWDIALPIEIEGRHIATLFVGQFFYEGEEVDLELFRRQAEEFGFDWPSYKHALESVPVFSRERVGHMMEYYRNLVNELASEGLAILRQRRAEERLKASLREKEVLIKEIHHRVKNNLNVVSSLIGLQMASESDPRLKEALGRSQGRVYAIALIYELLYLQEDLARIDLGPYLESLVARLHELHSAPGLLVHERVRSEPITLDVDLATNCGIVVGEFLTNAYKHAFRGRAEGRIEVEAALREGGVEVRVSDDGSGGDAAAIAASTSTLGMTLVRAVAEGQLRGRVEIREEGGLSCLLSFPLERQAEGLR